MVVVAGLWLGGCSQNVVIENGPQYPNVRQSEVLDIQVIRDSTVITLANTTARAIPPCRMWVNRWYSLEFAGLGVGETVELSLADFKNQYGEPFKAGGFFATERAENLVQAQIEVDGKIKGLIVVTPPDTY